MKKTVTIAASVGGLALVLTSCGQAPWQKSVRDLENVTVRNPDRATIWNNVDQYPNIVQLCVDGVGFATTTRPDFGSIMRVPEWDAACARVAGQGRVMR